MSWLFNMLLKISNKLDHVVEQNDEILAEQLLQRKEIDLILQFVSPPPAVRFDMIIEVAGSTSTPNKEGVKNMAKAKGKLKISILDNGLARAVLTPIDAAGLPTNLQPDASVPVWAATNSDGSVADAVTLTPSADGLSCDIGPSTPPKLASGILISADSTLADGVTKVHGDNAADPLNVVAGPAGSFVMSITGA